MALLPNKSLFQMWRNRAWMMGNKAMRMLGGMCVYGGVDFTRDVVMVPTEAEQGELTRSRKF